MRSLISETIVAQRLRKQYRRASFSFGLSQTIPFSKKQYGLSYIAEVTSGATARVCLIEHATSRQKKLFTRRKHTQKSEQTLNSAHSRKRAFKVASQKVKKMLEKLG